MASARNITTWSNARIASLNMSPGGEVLRALAQYLRAQSDSLKHGPARSPTGTVMRLVPPHRPTARAYTRSESPAYRLQVDVFRPQSNQVTGRGASAVWPTVALDCISARKRCGRCTSDLWPIRKSSILSKHRPDPDLVGVGTARGTKPRVGSRHPTGYFLTIFSVGPTIHRGEGESRSAQSADAGRVSVSCSKRVGHPRRSQVSRPRSSWPPSMRWGMRCCYLAELGVDRVDRNCCLAMCAQTSVVVQFLIGP